MHAPFDTLSFVALEAAFTKGEEWRQELLEYLRENKKWLDERISRIPGLSICHSEGTYCLLYTSQAACVSRQWSAPARGL